MASDAHPGLDPVGHGRRNAALLVAGLALVVATIVAVTGREDPVDRPAEVEERAAAGADPSVSEAPTVVGPFGAGDLPSLVLQPREGERVAEGLGYWPSGSGSATPTDIRHYTLMPPDTLMAAGFVDAHVSIFMTPDFEPTFGREGTDLLTLAMLFGSPAEAAEALKAFDENRQEQWEDWTFLPAAHGIRLVTGLLGSDNVSVAYPTVGFLVRVGNVILLGGSQGGSNEGQRPLPARVVRSVAEELLARARERA